MSSKFYVTTPIYYVNAAPHIGHAYTTLAADSMARYARTQLGDWDVHFVTGTDEHGLKIQRSAEAAGIPPQEFADNISQKYVTLWDRMGISYDDFVRTTEQRHIDTVQFLFSYLREKGYIYKGEYSGRYCVSDEAYVDADVCPDCGRPTEIISEENYYFRLSGFQARLLALYESDEMEITPVSRKNEIIAMVRKGLQDLSISRTSFDWGVKVPGDEKHVVYVWLDALANYLTGVGYTRDADLFEAFWPANVHVMGKEIIRFHCVYWPAFLMAAGLELPRRIQAHGWLLVDEQKMSKSKGNAFCVEDILDYIRTRYALHFPLTSVCDLDLFATDVLRFYLFRDIAFGSDGTFSLDKLISRYNADLANGLGNLVSRVFMMIVTHFDGRLPLHGSWLSEDIEKAERQAFASYAEGNLTQVWHDAMELVATTDRFFTQQEPWKHKDDLLPDTMAHILGSAYLAIRAVHRILEPLIPFSMSKLGYLESPDAIIRNATLFPRLKKDWDGDNMKLRAKKRDE